MSAATRCGFFAIVATLGCSGPTNTGRPTCPPDYAEDTERAARVGARLSSVPEGRELTRYLDTHVMCFAEGGIGVITPTHQLLLASELDDGEDAARLGHLLVHARDGLPLEEDEAPRRHAALDCDARVAQALDREAVAHVVEVRLQAALDVRPRRHAFEFTADVLASPNEAEAIALVRRYLDAHPTGAPGIDGLAAGYRQRCAAGG